jgi:hypothetical protein
LRVLDDFELAAGGTQGVLLPPGANYECSVQLTAAPDSAGGLLAAWLLATLALGIETLKVHNRSGQLQVAGLVTCSLCACSMGLWKGPRLFGTPATGAQRPARRRRAAPPQRGSLTARADVAMEAGGREKAHALTSALRGTARRPPLAVMGHPAYFLQGALVPDYSSSEGYGYKTVDVMLSGGVIASLRPAGEAPPPAGAEVVDCKDKLLIPGSVNAHTHTSEHWARGVRSRAAHPAAAAPRARVVLRGGVDVAAEAARARARAPSRPLRPAAARCARMGHAWRSPRS